MKTSTLLLILSILIVMTIPYWMTKPLNDKIAKGEIGDLDKETEAKLYRYDFKDINKLIVDGERGKVVLKIMLDSTNQLVMDTVLKNYVNLSTQDGTLKIQFDTQKYDAWLSKSIAKANSGNHTHNNGSDYEMDVVAVVDEQGESSGENRTTVEIEVHVQKLEHIKAFKASIDHQSYVDNFINYPLTLELDSSHASFDYLENKPDSNQEDSNSDDVRVVKVMQNPIRATLKNGSDVSFSFYENIDMNVTLINSHINIAQNYAYKHLAIAYDKNSDVELFLSQLKWVKLKALE